MKNSLKPSLVTQFGQQQHEKKVRYKTERAARRKAVFLNDGQRVYKCEICVGWHLTRS